MKCWICGGDGTTGEHKIKRSDLCSTFGRPTQTNPLYFRDNKVMAGMSDMSVATRTSDRSGAFATWFYCIGSLAVNVMFAADGKKRQGLVGAWHPKFGTNKTTISDFQWEE